MSISRYPNDCFLVRPDIGDRKSFSRALAETRNQGNEGPLVHPHADNEVASLLHQTHDKIAGKVRPHLARIC